MAEDFSHIFQFTPLREGRHRLMRYRIRFKSFQFTPLREGRLPYYNAQQTAMPISIHAPPRGATRRPAWLRGPAPYFNSRPSARGDFSVSVTVQEVGTFQFTPLREGRRPRSWALPLRAYFNSRPSARGDSKRYAISANLLFNPHKLPRFSSRAM